MGRRLWEEKEQSYLVPSHKPLCIAALAEATGDKHAHPDRERITSVTEFVTKST